MDSLDAIKYLEEGKRELEFGLLMSKNKGAFQLRIDALEFAIRELKGEGEKK